MGFNGRMFLKCMKFCFCKKRNKNNRCPSFSLPWVDVWDFFGSKGSVVVFGFSLRAVDLPKVIDSDV